MIDSQITKDQKNQNYKNRKDVIKEMAGDEMENDEEYLYSNVIREQ